MSRKIFSREIGCKEKKHGMKTKEKLCSDVPENKKREEISFKIIASLLDFAILLPSL